MHKATIIAREERGYYGGPNSKRYLAILDENDDEGNLITQRCDLLAMELLKQHAVLGSRKRERAWELICYCLTDALWPEYSKCCDGNTQLAAIEWLGSGDGDDALDTVGLNQDYACKIVSRLSQADEEGE